MVKTVWLAFQALPLFPVVPPGRRAMTTGSTSRGKSEQFTWPVWSVRLSIDEVRVLLGPPDLAEVGARERQRRGSPWLLRVEVNRNPQGYGNFTASMPV